MSEHKPDNVVNTHEDSIPFQIFPDEGDNSGKQKTETDARAMLNTKSKPAVATMPAGRYDPFYNMEHPHRGKAYIFNHETFDINLPDRTGTHIDLENLTIVLENLGFDVTPFNNLPYAQIHQRVTELSSMDHSGADCVLIAVMTHGEVGMLYAKDTHYRPDLLWSPFTGDRCPSLAGKPKIFLIQACQGDKLDGGVMLVKKHCSQMDGSMGVRENAYRIPVHADFLIARSTVPGYYSWREPGYGSWFIQTLCQELQDNAYEQDILRLLTFVCQKVSLFKTYNPSDLSKHLQKQIPSISSMLTRLLIFKRKPLSSDGVRSLDVARPINTRLKPPYLSE